MRYTAAMQAAGASPTAISAFSAYLPSILPAFGIDTVARAAAFLAQCHVESAGFARLQENLTYTTAQRLVAVWPSRFRNAATAAPYVRNPERLANCVYAGRLGNGPEASGDGWRFRGRGLKQLTGRDNYSRAGAALGRPYVTNPDLVRQPEDALRTACWFWRSNGLGPLADAGAHDQITRRVNGPAMLQAAERRRLAGIYAQNL